MSPDVIAWLDTTEGRAWHLGHARPPIQGGERRAALRVGAFAHILPDPGADGTPPVRLGCVDPAHDSCGRPVLRETR